MLVPEEWFDVVSCQAGLNLESFSLPVRTRFTQKENKMLPEHAAASSNGTRRYTRSMGEPSKEALDLGNSHIRGAFGRCADAVQADRALQPVAFLNASLQFPGFWLSGRE